MTASDIVILAVQRALVHRMRKPFGMLQVSIKTALVASETKGIKGGCLAKRQAA